MIGAISANAEKSKIGRYGPNSVYKINANLHPIPYMKPSNDINLFPSQISISAFKKCTV